MKRLLVELLDAWADRMDRVVMRVHDRADVGDGSKPELVCLAHRPPEPWPCDDWFSAMNRITARKHGPQRASLGRSSYESEQR